MHFSQILVTSLCMTLLPVTAARSVFAHVIVWYHMDGRGTGANHQLGQIELPDRA